MKRTLSILLILALTLSAVPALAAEGAHTFLPAVSPGETVGETQVDTGIPGMTLTLGADAWSCTPVDIPIVSASGVSYQSFLTGKANPKPAEGTGTYFSFAFDDTVGTGSLEVMYRLNSGKAFYIMDNGEAMDGFNGMKLEVSADTSTTLIVEGGHTYTVYASGSKLRLYGCTFQNVDPKEVFAAEIAAFPFDRVRGENPDAAHVDADLALMDSYESQFGSCDVSWTSSAPSVINVDGTVNCQKTETNLTLTGHFSVQENRDLAADVTFPVTVLADPDDASAVAVAREALTLGDTSSVKRDLELPGVGKRGTTVTWKSSDESVVGADGKVYPAADQDQSATLTATIQRGDATATKDFAVTVAGIVPVTLDSWVYSDGAGSLRFTPMDGDLLLTVNMTCNDPNPDPDDVVTLSVYTADGTLKASHDFNMAEWFADGLGGVLVGQSLCMSVTRPTLPVDAGDYFEMTAHNTRTGETLIDPVRADDSLTPGAKLYVVGDSTASVYGDDRYPRKGWAQMLGSYFDGVEVVDLALSGRSSRSFKAEANYTTLKNSLKKGDYLLIQFGHNDNKADAYADPNWDFTESRYNETSFQSSMFEYIQLAWEKGAHPIIATSISRRKLSDEELEKYVRAAQMLSQATSTPCIDLYANTHGWISQVGVDVAQDMFNCVKPHDSRFMDYAPFAGSEFYEKGSSDDTHLNLYGADLIAQWAADAIRGLGLPLAQALNGYRAVYPLPSYAQAVEGQASALPFTDVAPGDWFYESAKAVCDKGLFAGTDATHFSPGMETSRAMVATLLWRLAGKPQAGDVYFQDVSSDSWYIEAVRWCAEQGIVLGYDNGNFAPDDPISREQLATMIFRYVKLQGQDVVGESGQSAPLPFFDADMVGDWARDAIGWLVDKGLLTGKPGNLVDPIVPITRAETAVVLDRLMTLLGK